MSESKGLSGELTFILIVAIFAAGFWLGTSIVKKPDEVYVFESHQPVRAIFDKTIPGSADTESFTVTEGFGDDRREFIFYYWVESDAVDGYMRKQLHWSWREVTGP